MEFNRGLKDLKPYVGGKPKKEAQDRYNIKEPVKLNSNENVLGSSPLALAIAKKNVEYANLYPEASNIELRTKIAEVFDVNPENCFVGNGADEVIYYVAMTIINDKDEVIIPKITFPIYEIAFRIMRAKIVYSRMTNLAIDTDDIVRKISKRTKVLCLCNPNNPTGHALPKKEVYSFIEKIPHNVLILMDEAYMEFAEQDESADTISQFKEGHKNLFIIKTLSKIYGLAGLRVGYGIGDEGIIEHMNRIKLPFNISIVSQNAALGALEDSMFLKKTVDITKEGKSFIYRGLEELGLGYIPSSTNFILIDTKRDADIVTEELMREGVLVRSAKNYGIPRHIRVTVGTAEQNKKFIKALKKIC
ncbi:MAG: histidinol-phosphate transaminase [Spirochaetota bacterium]|nr:MAG: histidinol-phosphate transaminase [Spirochaetota bacterium]